MATTYNLASGSPTPVDRRASPRAARRYQRHARFDRLRYSQQEIAYINVQANRLGTSFATLWDYLFSNTSGAIKAASNTSSLKSFGTLENTGK